MTNICPIAVDGLTPGNLIGGLAALSLGLAATLPVAAQTERVAGEARRFLVFPVHDLIAFNEREQGQFDLSYQTQPAMPCYYFNVNARRSASDEEATNICRGLLDWHRSNGYQVSMIDGQACAFIAQKVNVYPGSGGNACMRGSTIQTQLRSAVYAIGPYMVSTAEAATPPKQTPPPIEPLLAVARGASGGGVPQGAGLGPQPGEQVVTIVAANPAQNSFTLRIEPMKPAPPLLGPNDFVPAFGTLAAQVARSAEDHIFVHVNFIGPDGQPVMAASPYLTDAVINAAETSARLSVAAAEAGANWVKNNPEAATGLAVATAVSAFLPAAPIAAYLLGASGEAAVVGTATEAVIGGVISSGTEAFVTSTLKEIGSDRSAGDKLRNIAGSTAASALTSIPSSLMGSNVTAIMGQFVAQKAAGNVGAAASKGVDMAINALGVRDAAQQVLTGQLPADGPTIRSGGTIITSLSPQPGFR